MRLCATAIFLVGLSAGCADQIALYPSRQAVDPEGARRQVVEIQGKSIEFYSAESPSARRDGVRALVLMFVGSGGRAEKAAMAEARRWNALPVEVWAMNYPGFGGSPGRARLKELAPLGLAAYDVLVDKAGGRPVFLGGESLGAAVALHVMANRQTPGAMLRTPPPMRELLLGRYGWWNLWLIGGVAAAGMPRELDSLANAARAKAPVVFILVKSDGIVPLRYQERVAKAYGGPSHILVTPAGHSAPVLREIGAELNEAMLGMWRQAMGAAPATTRAAGAG